MYVSLSKDYVVGTAHFDLVSVFWVEQHTIADLHVPDIRTGGNDLCPRETFSHLCGRGNQNSAHRSALTLYIADSYENTIIQHLDGQAITVAVRWPNSVASRWFGHRVRLLGWPNGNATFGHELFGFGDRVFSKMKDGRSEHSIGVPFGHSLSEVF